MRYNLEQMAAVAYFANCGMQVAVGSPFPVTDLWAEAGEETRESYRHGVTYALTHQPTPAEIHAEWVRYHSERGAVHPNLVPREELPPGEADKDEVFLTLVAFLARQQ